MKEEIVLVNEHNKPIGRADKLTVHHWQTPLHRGFSVFLFGRNNQLLLQQRSKKKITWPLVWSNSCCGHPKLHESSVDAAKRCLQFELGITKAKIYEIVPNYRYRFEKDGIVENEFCPVLVAFTDQQPIPNAHEVKTTRWISWEKWLTEVENNQTGYSQWCIEETKLLNKNKKFAQLLFEAK